MGKIWPKMVFLDHFLVIFTNLDQKWPLLGPNTAQCPSNDSSMQYFYQENGYELMGTLENENIALNHSPTAEYAIFRGFWAYLVGYGM